jgi:hypothetical protein
VGGVKKYVRDRVWAVLKEHQGIGSRAIADVAHMQHRRVSNALQELRRDGRVRREGPSSEHCRWYAIGERPYCKWGLSANSLKNLQVPLEERLRRLGVKMKPPPIPVNSGCALQDCWLNLNVARTSDND